MSQVTKFVFAHARDNGPAVFGYFAFLPTCTTQNDDDDDDDDGDDDDDDDYYYYYYHYHYHYYDDDDAVWGGWVGGEMSNNDLVHLSTPLMLR